MSRWEMEASYEGGEADEICDLMNWEFGRKVFDWRKAPEKFELEGLNELH
jgi:hypothetical protein